MTIENVLESASYHMLDCTLRDGSYEVDFRFDQKITQELASKLEGLGVSLIEVGHGVGLGASRSGRVGAAVCSDEEYLAAMKGLNTAAWGMFAIPGIANLDDLKLASEYGMSFVRLGVDVTRAHELNDYISTAKELGMFVFVNFMKSYAAEKEEFSAAAVMAIDNGADAIYVVDSAGGMLPNEVRTYIQALKTLDTPPAYIGFHGHDNLGLAVANSICAIESGANIIDVSLKGLGRSAGNASFEKVLAALVRAGEKIHYEPLKIMELSDEYVTPFVSNTRGNSIDTVAGMAMFHSSYFPVIEKYANKYKVDPKELILRLCQIDKINAPENLVEKIAKTLRAEGNYGSWDRRFGHYYVNEQGSIF